MCVEGEGLPSTATWWYMHAHKRYDMIPLSTLLVLMTCWGVLAVIISIAMTTKVAAQP